MKENIIMLKRWYELARPRKKDFIIQFVTALICNISLMIAAIPAANVITSLRDLNYNSAYFWLAIGFINLFIRQIFWLINYLNIASLIGYNYKRMQDLMFDKIFKTKEIEFKKTSTQKIINILSSDLYQVSELPRHLMRKFAKLVRTIVTLVVLFSVNIYMGFVMILIIIINFFILNFINSKLASITAERKIAKDKIFENFSDIMKNRNLIVKLDAKDTVKKNYDKKVDKYALDIKKKDFLWAWFKDGGFFALYNFVIIVVTVYLISLVSSGAMTLGLYLILVPYVSQVITESKEVLNVTSDIKNADTATLRINTILNFSDKELIEFGDNTNDDIEGNIEFNKVSYKNDIPNSIVRGKIKDVSFSIKKGDISVIKGLKESGKRQIMYLLARAIKPDSGNIMMDGVNIYEYDPVTYKSNFNFVTYKPTFINGSILKNLKLAEKNKNEIIKVCKEIGLHKYIMSLPKKYNTDVNKNYNSIPNDKLFLLGLARTLLTKSEVIAIYEFPNSLNSSELLAVKESIKKLADKETIIIFTATEKCDDIADKIINIKRGKVDSVDKK